MRDLDTYLPSISAGDAQAFGLWVASAEASIRRSLRSFAASVDTEAVVQETLLRVWQLAPRVERDGRGNSLLRLAHRMARNLALDEVRRRRLQAPDAREDVADELAIEPVLPDPMLARAIVDCEEKLPKQPRAALHARLKGGADRDLAAGLGMKLNTFLKNVGRARKLLGDCLERGGIVLLGGVG